MSNLDDVRRLKEEIVASLDERMSTISNIVKSTSELAASTREMTEGFRGEREAMSDDLRMKMQNLKQSLNENETRRRKDTQESARQRQERMDEIIGAFRHNGSSEFAKSVNEMLNKFRSNRLDDFNNLMQHLQHQVVEIKKGVKNMQADFRETHQEMSNDLHQTLSDFKSNLKNFRMNLSQNESERFKAARQEIKMRTDYLEKMFGEVAGMVSEFRNDHSEMRKFLREAIDFKGFNKERLQDFNAIMGQIKKNQQQREQDTARMLADFNTVHSEMSKNLSNMLSAMKSELKHSNDTRQNQAHEESQKRLNYIHDLKTEISTMLTTLRRESKEVMREWNDLSRIMAQKSQEEMTPNPDPGAKTKMKVTASVKKEKTEKADSPEFRGNEKDAIQAIIDESGITGIRLVEISKKMDKKWQALIPQVKSLLEAEKIRKENNRYFSN